MGMIEGTASQDGGSASAVLEIYKLAVEMADRVSARRGTTNSFFLSAQTAFVTAAGFAGARAEHTPWWVTVSVALGGILFAAAWYVQLLRYQELNRAKFQVIQEMEKDLPRAPYTREWQLMNDPRGDAQHGRFAGLGTIERRVPWVFAVLHILIMIGGLTT
jgi:hypothetical protein